MVFILIANPLWSSFTDAYYKNDFRWIKQVIKKFRIVTFGLSGVVVIMIVISQIFYRFWVGDAVQIPYTLSFFFGLNVVLMMITTPYVFFINGTGIIKLQLIYSILIAVVNIPLSIFLATYMELGSTGVIMSTCFTSFCALILWPIQYKKIINKTATGIWAK